MELIASMCESRSYGVCVQTSTDRFDGIAL
jgi:hypothetical protein